MRLQELVTKLDYSLMSGSVDTEVTGITPDSRAVVPGGLFIAIKGAMSDGHQYVKSAIENGASSIIIQDGFEACLEDVPEDITVLKTNDTRLALAYASASFYGNPADKLFTIGITGTKGKTTTTYMIKSVLELRLDLLVQLRRLLVIHPFLQRTLLLNQLRFMKALLRWLKQDARQL